MDRSNFQRDVTGIAALNEPVRRDLYLFVIAQEGPVGRDQASDGVGIARHTAKFHLDKLVEDGLLDTEFKRLTGRRGPGAGRPTKLYKRSAAQFDVTLPERHYDLAGQLMAQAIDQSVRTGEPVVSALHTAAAELGAMIGAQTVAPVGPPRDEAQRLSKVCDVLATHGYEPRLADGTVTLLNCPFHLLAQEHTELVCGMNLALLRAVAEQGDGDGLTARLHPGEDRCCVVLSVA
jgi:predicted ArsR family transcriptional regulator